MAATVELLNPKEIKPNQDNPRMIFREDELLALEESIAQQGILVPLTIYRDGKYYTLLDGERRLRCARKLGLHKVPVIVQEKPDRITNIMMMFAIHNARRDWDPLPTALKLEELEAELHTQYGRDATEAELAAAASLSRGEVRRYRKILNLPTVLREELLKELERPRAEQKLTVDHVIESISGVSQLVKRGITDERNAERLIRTTVDKFRRGVLRNTTDPRLFSRIARSYERDEIELSLISSQLKKYEKVSDYTIEDIFNNTSADLDYEHGTEQLIYRTISRLEEIIDSQEIRSESLLDAIRNMERVLRKLKSLG